MNRSLLEGDPHAVLEGMLIAAYAIWATAGTFTFAPNTIGCFAIKNCNLPDA